MQARSLFERLQIRFTLRQDVARGPIVVAKLRQQLGPPQRKRTVKMRDRTLGVPALSTGVCQAQLTLELLQVAMVRHLGVEKIRPIALDDVPPTRPTGTSAFERTPQHEYRLLEATRVGPQRVQVRPELLEQLVSRDVPTTLEVQQHQQRLGLAASEAVVDRHLVADVGSQWPEQVQTQHRLGAHRRRRRALADQHVRAMFARVRAPGAEHAQRRPGRFLDITNWLNASHLTPT